MTNPAAARSFLLSEVELLQPFDFVGVFPSGSPLHIVEVTRTEAGGIEVRATRPCSASSSEKKSCDSRSRSWHRPRTNGTTP